ncbi:MAG TPA: hypothetical protein VD814_00590 [Nocardioides sp.]|nr:hypothetical protein [Nocardioides sp.]
MLVRVVVAALLALLTVGCSEDPSRPGTPRLASVPPEPAPPFDGTREPAEAVLSLVPQEAGVVTVTDWDQVRVQLGQPDLTSGDLMTDRLAFWQRVETEAATLTDGLLRSDDSRLGLDYGFTQDDVDWEARFTGEGVRGFVLALRPDLDLAGVRRAIADGVGPLAGAELRAEDHLVVSGVADEDVWATEGGWAELVGEPASSTYLRRGCVPLAAALGPDAGVEEQEAVLQRHPVTSLEELDGFAVAFRGLDATVRVAPGRADLFERLRLGEDWPVADFPRTYVDGAADPASGRIGYSVADPRAAARLALLDELPFAVCNEVVPREEPTGL